ncbi:MAG: hypothetical protein R3C68_09810 [Myxococcota bacterium]
MMNLRVGRTLSAMLWTISCAAAFVTGMGCKPVRHIEIQEAPGDEAPNTGDADDELCVPACEAPRRCGGGSHPRVCGQSFYISAQGGLDTNSGVDASSAWATFDHAWSVLQAGDVLVVRDGIYPPMQPSVSGTENAPILIRAQSDGGAVFDAATLDESPCAVQGQVDDRLHDIVFEGLTCRNGTSHNVFVHYADRVSIRRVTAILDSALTDLAPFRVLSSTQVLLEDTATKGEGTGGLYSVRSSDAVVVRRAFGLWTSPTNNGNISILTFANCVGCVLENSVFFAVGGSTESLCANFFNCDDCTMRGNVVRGPFAWSYVMSGDRLVDEGVFSNNVAMQGRRGLFVRQVADLRVRRMTAAEISATALAASPENQLSPVPSSIGVRVRDSVVVMAAEGFSVSSSTAIVFFDNDFNDLFSVTSPYANQASMGPNEISIDPEFQIATYSAGAYLQAVLPGQGENGASMGAEVLYRYVEAAPADTPPGEGVVTDIPLWPWPMEQRILDEFSVSVTFEANGGIWPHLDGVYP